MLRLKDRRHGAVAGSGLVLRGLLLIIAIFGVWLGIKVNAARRQAAAVAAILKAGGSVNFDYQMIPAKSGDPDDFDIDPNAKPGTAGWFRGVFGDDFFRTPIYVVVSTISRDGSHNDLAQTLIQLHDIKKLDFVGEGDSDFKLIGSLKHLEYLNLYYCNFYEVTALDGQMGILECNGISEAGIDCLKQMTFLKRLGLTFTISRLLETDHALIPADGLTTLRRSLKDTKVTCSTKSGASWIEQ